MDLIACWAVGLIARAIETALPLLETLGTWTSLRISCGQLVQTVFLFLAPGWTHSPKLAPVVLPALKWDLLRSSCTEVCPGFATTCSVTHGLALVSPYAPGDMAPSISTFMTITRKHYVPPLHSTAKSFRRRQAEKGNSTAGKCLGPGHQADC